MTSVGHAFVFGGLASVVTVPAGQSAGVERVTEEGDERVTEEGEVRVADSGD